jgi:hypothetical protein
LSSLSSPSSSSSSLFRSREGQKSNTWRDNELSSRTRFLGRNRKYRQTIMAICRKNCCVLYGVVLLGILFYTSIKN